MGISMKKIICLFVLSLSLAGCVVVPDGGTYYPQARYHEAGCMHCWHGH
jgi:hypothetical protein